MSWSENAARCFLRLPMPRGTLRATAVRTRQPARHFADEPDQRPPGPGRERDVSPSKVRREAIICPPAIQTTWPYRLPPQIPPPPPRRPPPSRPPQPPPRPATRLDIVRTLRVPSRVNKPPPPRSPDDPPVITGLCSLAEATTCPRIPGPGKLEEQPKVEECPPSPPPIECCPLPPPPPPPPKDTCCISPSQAEAPKPIFSCDPPICCSPGPCPPDPTPCPPATPPPIVLRFFSQLFWWGGRMALAASLVYWTYVYGLWGSSDETKAIVDSWKSAIGYTAKEGGSGSGFGFWLRVSKVWDGGVKMLFNTLALALRYLMGPGMGTDPREPRHQTAEIARTPEPDEDDDLAPCGCCKRKPDAQGDLPG